MGRRCVGKPRSASWSIVLLLILWTSTVLFPLYNPQPVTAFPVNKDPDAKLTGGELPQEIKIIDVNYDSLPDIVTVNDDGNDISFFYQKPDRTFNATPDFNLFIGDTPTSAAFKDFNRDGLLDIVAIDNACYPWPLNCNTTIFYQRLDFSYPVNADQVIGRSDIVPSTLAAGDYNSDGLLDFAMSGGLTGRIFVYLQLLNGGFPDDPDWILSTLDMAAFGLASADLNGDGLDDLVLVNHDSDSVSLYYQKSNSTLPLVPNLNLTTGDGPTHVTPKDINGDGLVDLAVSNGMEGTFSLFYQRKNYTFPTTPDQKISTGGTGNFVPIRADIGDVNNDGLVDVIVSRATKTATHVYLQNTSGGFPSSPSFILNAPSTTQGAIGDLNGDGLNDIAMSVYYTPFVNETVFLFYQEGPTLPPNTTLSIGTPRVNDTIPIVTSSTPISFNAIDRSGTGIDSTCYSINGGPWWIYQKGTTFNLLDEGANKIDFYSIDNASNVESIQTRYVAVDNTPPVSTLSVGDPHFQSSALWVSPATNLSLSATDGPSTSAGVNSTSYRIWNSSGWSQWMLSQNPFRLNDEGQNIVEFFSEDRLGNVEPIKNLSMMVDGTPPTTFISAPFLLNGSRMLSLAAMDMGVGVSSTRFSLDGNPWQEYAGPIYLPGDVDHLVLYRSEDMLYNLETERSTFLPKATQGPLTTLQVGSPKHGILPVFVRSSTPLTLTATDRSGSGINTTLHSIDGGQWTEYSVPFTLPGEGIHQLSYYSVDNLSQDGTVDTVTLIVDDTGPDVTISAYAGSHMVRDGSRYATSSSTFGLLAKDEGPLPVGAGEVEYEIWSPSGWSPPVTFSGPFSLGNPEGERYIRYQGVDFLGNVGILKNSTVLVDDTPPNSSMEQGSPKYGEYISPDTPLTIVTIDSGPEPVGLDTVEYRLDGDATWLRYSSPIRLAGLQDGTHEVRYRGVDLLGNTEVERTASVILDGSPPVTTTTNIPADVTRETVLTLTATDTGCGLNFTQYKIDDGPWVIYAGGFTLDEGDHDILYESGDNLGNMEDEKSLHVNVRRTESGENNYKPLVASVFAVILVILGLLVSWKRPWKGERKKIAMLKTFAFFSLPFILAEAVTGIASHLTGELSIPPIVGLGAVVDVCVLLAGFSSLAYYVKMEESNSMDSGRLSANP